MSARSSARLFNLFVVCALFINLMSLTGLYCTRRDRLMCTTRDRSV